MISSDASANKASRDDLATSLATTWKSCCCEDKFVVEEIDEHTEARFATSREAIEGADSTISLFISFCKRLLKGLLLIAE